ncbi:MAG: DUF1343 domain-containing protein [Oligoflexia bacterium]|nr:DUF1343 domain-containing protein [Oligoflexia bacterium]
MKLGIESLLEDKKIISELRRENVGLVCHPASVNHKLEHSLDLLHSKIKLKCAFGPQHGAKGDKQDNMIETQDEIHSKMQIPVFSLYGEVRKPTAKMMSRCDVVIFDLQDVGTRIYTYVATLLYVMQACAEFGKKLIVCDRPNPIGRQVEGLSLEKGFESFVGVAYVPMRHGLTLGELALYFKDCFNINLDLRVVKMKGYKAGWPKELAWVNPSPNLSTHNGAMVFPGSVMIEGTTLSEGRGTTRALELIGASDLDFSKVLELMRKKAPQWIKGCVLRECFFEPTFHKHEKRICHGVQIHTDNMAYNANHFKPFRIVSLMLKCVRELYPQYEIFRKFNYEYVETQLAFDVITGSSFLRKWIDDASLGVKHLEDKLKKDEQAWLKKYKKYWLY